MTNPTTAVVLSERHGHTSVLTINRPEARNAVNMAVSVALGDELEAADRDPEVRVIVLTGAGRLSFCAGADLKAVARGEAVKPTEGSRAPWGFAGYVSHPVGTPTIAAVNGFALGGGTELVLASDLAVASEGAMFGLPEVSRGLVAAAGGVFRLPDQVPRKLAMEIILTGEPVSAARALELGLVNKVVPQEDLLPAALELADRIGRNAPLAVRASKAIALGLDPDGVTGEVAAWERSARLAAEMLRTEDTREGLAAFAEKRAPVWRAR
jgi:crotonobetainyl-CoA hydratase